MIKSYYESRPGRTEHGTEEADKAAAALWKIVRESDMKKKYSHDLLEKYKDDMGLAEAE